MLSRELSRLSLDCRAKIIFANSNWNSIEIHAIMYLCWLIDIGRACTNFNHFNCCPNFEEIGEYSDDSVESSRCICVQFSNFIYSILLSISGKVNFSLVAPFVFGVLWTFPRNDVSHTKVQTKYCVCSISVSIGGSSDCTGCSRNSKVSKCRKSCMSDGVGGSDGVCRSTTKAYVESCNKFPTIQHTTPPLCDATVATFVLVAIELKKFWFAFLVISVSLCHQMIEWKIVSLATKCKNVSVKTDFHEIRDDATREKTIALGKCHMPEYCKLQSNQFDQVNLLLCHFCPCCLHFIIVFFFSLSLHDRNLICQLFSSLALNLN